MKKVFLITATVVVCFLAALNITFVFENDNGKSVSLDNIEALAWIEDPTGIWYPEPGDDPEDHNNHPENNSLQYIIKDCQICNYIPPFGKKCPKEDTWTGQYQLFYCTTSTSDTDCDQSLVDSSMHHDYCEFY